MANILHPNLVFRQAQMGNARRYAISMPNRATPTSLKALLAENVGKLKKHRQLSQDQIAKAAKLSQSSVGRVLSASNAADVNTLAGLARAFDVEPWHLLVPGMRPDNLPVLKSMNPAEEALYDRLRVLSAELAALKKGDR